MVGGLEETVSDNVSQVLVVESAGVRMCVFGTYNGRINLLKI